MPKPKKDPVLRQRGYTSIIYAGLWAASFTHSWLFLGFIGVLYVWGVAETQRLLFRRTVTGSLLLQLTGAILLAVVFGAIQAGAQTPIGGLGIFTCIYIVVTLAFLFGKITSRGRALLPYFLSLCYPGLGLTCFALIAFPAGGYDFDFTRPLAFLLFVWGNDSFAYLVGRRWGRSLIAPGISPKKSWEGFAGGGLGTAFTALLVWWFLPGVEHSFVVIAALVVALFGPAGDLFESALKRRVGVKDSGRWLPGHGGVLDRIDSLLIAAPIYWAVEQLVIPLIR